MNAYEAILSSARRHGCLAKLLAYMTGGPLVRPGWYALWVA